MILYPTAALAGLLIGLWFRVPALIVASGMVLLAAIELGVNFWGMVIGLSLLQVFYLIGAVLTVKDET